jgi:hypothetical protein
VPRLFKRTGLSLDDIDLIELNEAFAAQAVAVIRELGFDEENNQRQRRRYRFGTSSGVYGSQIDRTDYQRNEAARFPVWYGDDVYRRRHGCGRYF